MVGGWWGATWWSPPTVVHRVSVSRPVVGLALAPGLPARLWAAAVAAMSREGLRATVFLYRDQVEEEPALVLESKGAGLEVAPAAPPLPGRAQVSQALRDALQARADLAVLLGQAPSLVQVDPRGLRALAHGLAAGGLRPVVPRSQSDIRRLRPGDILELDLSHLTTPRQVQEQLHAVAGQLRARGLSGEEVGRLLSHSARGAAGYRYRLRIFSNSAGGTARSWCTMGSGRKPGIWSSSVGASS